MDERGVLGAVGLRLWRHGTLCAPHRRQHSLEAQEGLEGRRRTRDAQWCVAVAIACLPPFTPFAPALFSMIPFIIVTDLFRISLFPGFAYTQLGTRQSRLPILYSQFPPPSLYRPCVVHQLGIMGLQLSHRIWCYLGWQRGR